MIRVLHAVDCQTVFRMSPRYLWRVHEAGISWSKFYLWTQDKSFRGNFFPLCVFVCRLQTLSIYKYIGWATTSPTYVLFTYS